MSAAADIFTRPGFETLLSAYPGTRFDDQWEARLARVGGKIYCLLSDTAPSYLTLKCGEASFDILMALEGVSQAPYFAKRQWVKIDETAPLAPDEVLAYIGRSHGLVAAGLTKKAQRELGIVPQF